MNKNFYFTYGCEGHPFIGGWTQVVADNRDNAVALFNMVHPQKSGFVDCAGIYTEEQFFQTKMYKQGSNLGYGVHEVIELSVYRK